MLAKIWHKLPFTGSSKPTIALITLAGVIAPESRTGRVINMETVSKALAKAFDVSGAKAVVVAINSPGGAPAQSRMIHARIRELSEKKKIPVISYIEDVGASGGYMLALAGDEIFADPFAIVGSIGVISAGFGFVDAIDKLGITRRVYASGANKSQLDPFKPEDPQDIARLESLLEKSHKLFNDMVRDRRAGKLTGAEDELFTGQFWIAGDAQAHGLIDGTGDLRALLKQKFGDDVQIRKIETEKKGLLGKLLGASHGGLVDPDAVVEAVEVRAAWARFGR